jgi:hypothetical protein
MEAVDGTWKTMFNLTLLHGEGLVAETILTFFINELSDVDVNKCREVCALLLEQFPTTLS